jgi:hypothetical protein
MPSKWTAKPSGPSACLLNDLIADAKTYGMTYSPDPKRCDLQLLYKVGNDLANSDAWPNWSADSEFRGIRDKTATERK